MERFLLIGFGLSKALTISAVLGLTYLMNYEPDRTRFPLRGLDVSHHQGPIDWDKASHDDVSFVYMKATEGGDHRDSLFATYLPEARAAGLMVGAYHFFTFCRPGSDQARNFVSSGAIEASALPPAVDLEFGGNCAARPDPARLRGELDAFLEIVEAQAGRRAILYATDEFLTAYGKSLPKRRLWVRSLMRTPDREDWAIWQYHNSGSVAGIRRPVDLNVMNDGFLAAVDKAPITP